MTLYTKPRAELFAQDAPPSEIQPFEDWLRGLGIAFDLTNGYPTMEGFNGLLQALNSYIKYLEQNGFSEWSSDLEYPVGAGVRVGAVWYRAKTQNTGKNPATSQNDWSVFLNASDLSFNDPLQVVNGVIGIKDASTTQKGAVRAATSTEVANRSNVTAFINPSNVGQTFDASLSANGWCRLPNGLILQWGVVFVGADQTKSVTFPVKFPSAVVNVQVSIISTEVGVIENLIVQQGSATTTGITLRSRWVGDMSGSLSGFTTNWLAIGY